MQYIKYSTNYIILHKGNLLDTTTKPICIHFSNLYLRTSKDSSVGGLIDNIYALFFTIITVNISLIGEESTKQAVT